MADNSAAMSGDRMRLVNDPRRDKLIRSKQNHGSWRILDMITDPLPIHRGEKAMRTILCCFLLLSLSSAAHAQEAQIERIDIAGKGIYQVTVGKLTPDNQTPTGMIAAVERAKLIEDTTLVPARIGLEFGIQYTIVGAPKGAEVPIRIVNVYPKQGLRNPKTGKTIQRAEIVRKKVIGDLIYTGYAFENEWEIVPGVWKFEIWHENRMLAEQSFTVTRP